MSEPPTGESDHSPPHEYDHISTAEASSKPVPEGLQVLRIPGMDCAAEEAEIRHALAKLPGLRSLHFQLGARTLAIDAPVQAIPQVLEAIRKAGFKPTWSLLVLNPVPVMTPKILSISAHLTTGAAIVA